MLPVVSNGETETARIMTLETIDGESLCNVARTPRVSVHNAVETAQTDGFEALRTMPVRALLDRISTAGQLFIGEGAPAATLTPPHAPFDRYQRSVVEATGLPAGWVRTSAHWLAFGLRHAAESLRAQSPTGDLDIYDDPVYTRETDVGLAFIPRVRVLGGMMPSNDPAVYAWPILALAMKIPIVLRPSDRDPLTAVRLARALRSAGVPESAVHVLPGDHSIGETVCHETDHAMAFGTEEAVGSFRTDPSIETYGPGKSVAILARDPTDRELDSLARGVLRSGGRACFCLTRLVATAECDVNTLAERLARRVTALSEPAHDVLLDERTAVPGFSPSTADEVTGAVRNIPGRDVTAAYREGCLTERNGIARLRPTVLQTDTLVPELPFQFAGVTERKPDAVVPPDGAYLAVVIGSDELERTLVRSPTIANVYGGRYPASVDLRETHETYLASFLYRTKTYDPS